MKTFNQHTNVGTLLEKVTSKDFKEAEGDTRIQIGIEYEVAACQMRNGGGINAGYDTDQMEQDVDRWIQQVVDFSVGYVDAKTKWREEIESAVETEIESLEDQVEVIQGNIDDADEEEDADEISAWKDDVSGLEDKIETLRNNFINDNASELGLQENWEENVDYPYMDGGSWEEWLDGIGYGSLPSNRDVYDWVAEATDYGETYVDRDDVYDLIQDMPHYFDDYDEDDFVESIDQDSSAWDDLVNIIDEEPEVEEDAESDGRQWFVTNDGSLGSDGVEIISPILKLKDGLENIEDMFKWIEEYGKTDGSTGIHINMSFDGYDMSKFDWLKLLMFVEEGAIYKDFADRKNETYAASMMKYFQQLDGKWDRLSTPEYFNQIRSGDMEGMQRVRDLISGGKYFGINFTKSNRIEFRYGGGPYSKKPKETRELILRYAAWMRIALDPTFKKKEYIKKVIKLVKGVGDKVATSDIYKQGTLLMYSEGFSGDQQIQYITDKDKKIIYVFNGGGTKILRQMKPREAISDFRFKYAALLQGYSLKSLIRGKLTREQSAANKFVADRNDFKKKDNSMKGLKKFVMSYKQ